MRQALGLYTVISVFFWVSSAASQPDQSGHVMGDDGASAIATIGAAVETTMAEDWRAICLSNRDDFQQGARRAEAGGWMVAPDSLFPFSRGVVGTRQVWIRSSAAGFKMLAIGRTTDNLVDGGQKFAARLCGVGMAPAETHMEQEVAALIRVPPNPSGAKPAHATYVYQHTPDGLIPIMGNLRDSATIKAIESPNVDIVQVGVHGKVGLVLLAIPEGH